MAVLSIAAVSAAVIRVADPAPPPLTVTTRAPTATPSRNADRPTRPVEVALDATATSKPLATPTPRSKDPEALPAGSPDDRRHVREAAVVFVETFTAYETGALGDRVEAGLRATASPELATTLLSQPPRLTPGHRPARAQLTGIGDLRVDGDRAYVLAALRRGGNRDGIALQLHRLRGRFYVVRID